ncbi:MAG TPA: hypothetical protein VK453_26635 [Micromonosporaceae bacterium]|nr:hypothetical protein [Micromonosporaceae bacterium]
MLRTPHHTAPRHPAGRFRGAGARMLAVAATVTALGAAGTVVSHATESDGGHPAVSPTPPAVFPQPGGGPVAIQALVTARQEESYLLDPTTGDYRALPYSYLQLSPDGRTVVVEQFDGEAKYALAERGALLRDGEQALRPIDLPPGTLHWSPDGTALLTTTLDKNTRQFTVHRYDVATGRLRHTPVALACDICTAGWAADSRRYVVSVRGADPQMPSALAQYLNPDGTPGPMLGSGADGFVYGAEAYSPSRRYVILEPARPFGPGELTNDKLPRVYDLRARRVVATIHTAHPLLGWYDNRHVVRLAVTDDEVPDTIEVVHIHTGRVTRRVAAAGLPPAVSIQLGSTAGLSRIAATRGF